MHRDARRRARAFTTRVESESKDDVEKLQSLIPWSERLAFFCCSSILGHIVLDEAAEEIKMNKKKRRPMASDWH